ncbi:MAG: hypothetical protein V4472_12870 [Pseudomonadota bacterium]
MTRPFLSIARLRRHFATGQQEELTFEPGVNLLVGRPNTGKTKWLQTLDFVLGDTGGNPFEGADETALAEKYDAAAADLRIGAESFLVERRWRESGGKGKVYVDGTAMLAKDFQHWLLKELGIPLLSFPKGNPASGQTWPELSFRILLRHVYRQQRFWSDIADKQPEGEQHASVLQFLGLAEKVYSADYEELVLLKRRVDLLTARRDQYANTLNELARDLLSDEDISVHVSVATIAAATTRLAGEAAALQERRTALLTAAQDEAIPAGQHSHIADLSARRSRALSRLESIAHKQGTATERLSDITRYRADLGDEIERMKRAEDAGAVLADLKITHCPACDQSVNALAYHGPDCFLCHQALPPEPVIADLGSVRLRFESDRLASELAEAVEFEGILKAEIAKHVAEAAETRAEIGEIEAELTPARDAIGALAQAEISAIDMALGRGAERGRQLDRVSAALELGADMTTEIARLEKEIVPVQKRVDDALGAIDFHAAAAQLEDGMNAYLEALNHSKKKVWLHSHVNVDISRTNLSLRVGRQRWNTALGGTDSLYFLMAYHYGLLTLSANAGAHYPGLSIIDVPGEFSGEAVADKENFIVQPFIDLLKRDEFAGAQLIITGASFTNLSGAHFQRLTHVHVA